MAFKLKSGNKPSFKQMAIGKEPMAESPYMQTDDVQYYKDEKGINILDDKGNPIPVPPGVGMDTKPGSGVIPEITKKDKREKPFAPLSTNDEVKEQVNKDTNITREQYVDGKLRKKTITYDNPKSLKGRVKSDGEDIDVIKGTRKEKSGRNLVKTKIRFTDSQGIEYVQKRKKKGSKVKTKTRRKGSLLSLEDKQKAKKFLNKFKKKNN